jgi:hypothetical protein
MAVDEVELRQGENAVAIQRRLEREVKAGQRLDRGQAGHLQSGLDAAPITDGELLGQQGIHRLKRRDLAALELPHDMIQHLQRPRHAQGDEMRAYPLEQGRRQIAASHRRAPRSARRRPTAA